MLKQPAKLTTKNIWIEEPTTIWINNWRNNKGNLCRETKRETTIIENNTQEQAKATRKDQLFLFQLHSWTDCKSKSYPTRFCQKVLTERQTSLLKRGLKIISTRKPNTIEIKSDIQDFTPMLQLIGFFHSENIDSSQETTESISDSLVKNKSNFCPPCNKNKFLGTTIDLINQQYLNNLSKYKTNFSKKHWLVLKKF